MVKNSRPVAVDLCAGAGGMSLGFEQAGFDVVASVEIDPVHCATYRCNFPNSVVICKSIENITGEEIRQNMKANGLKIDVVFAGLPCQGFSVIGKRQADDPRNFLFRHFIRIVKELDASYFVIENVRGFLSKRNGDSFSEMLESIKSFGYSVNEDYKLLNASSYGVPQNRERLFIMGYKSGRIKPSYPPKITYVKSSQANVATQGDILSICPSVIDAIGDLPNVEKYPELLERDWIDLDETDFGSPSLYASFLKGTRVAKDDFSYRRKFEQNRLTSSFRTKHSTQSKQRFLEVAPGKRDKKSRLHKLKKDGICVTLRAGTSKSRGSFTAPRPIHPCFPRCITVRESARLHSYPDWFRFHSTNWHGLRQVGNSVPPLLAKAVASEVIKATKIEPIKPSTIYELNEEFLLYMSLDKLAKIYGVHPDSAGVRIRKSSKKNTAT